MVEVSDFLASVEIFQQRRTTFSDGQRVVGVVDANALLCGQVAGLSADPGAVELLLLGIVWVVGHGMRVPMISASEPRRIRRGVSAEMSRTPAAPRRRSRGRGRARRRGRRTPPR